MKCIVTIATIAILIAIYQPLSLAATSRPAEVRAQISSDPYSMPVYEVFLYLDDGQLQNVTSLAAYSEDHVFLLGSYVGDRLGTTIVNNGEIVGYLQPYPTDPEN